MNNNTKIQGIQTNPTKIQRMDTQIGSKVKGSSSSSRLETRLIHSFNHPFLSFYEYLQWIESMLLKLTFYISGYKTYKDRTRGTKLGGGGVAVGGNGEKEEREENKKIDEKEQKEKKEEIEDKRR